MRAALAAVALPAAAAGIDLSCCSKKGPVNGPQMPCGSGIFGRPTEIDVGGTAYCCPYAASIDAPCPATPSSSAVEAPADMVTLARRRLSAAYASYCDAGKLTAWSCKWCAELGAAANGYTPRVAGDTLTGAQAYAAIIGDELIVAFRGSSNIQSWIQNADFPLAAVNWTGVPADVWAHAGFIRSYESVRAAVQQAVRDGMKQCPGCRVVVTGHSLGASEALLCAADLKVTLGLSSEVFTFGSPRTFNAAGAGWFHTSVAPDAHRMVNMKDTVPHLPTENMGYQHIPREVWRNNGEQHRYILCAAGEPEDPTCSYKIALAESTADDHNDYMSVPQTCSE